MDYRQARLELKKGRLHSFYLFSGTEDILKEELLAEMIGLMRRQGLAPEVLKLDGRKMEWQELRRELEQVTIFSRGRVLLVKDAPYFKAPLGDIKKGDPPPKGRYSAYLPGEEEISSILKNNSRDTLLIFFVSEVDRRKKLTRFMDKEGVLVEFPPLRGSMLSRWIREELSREAKAIDEDALALLVQRCGENLSLLKRELEKLVTFLGEEKIISRLSVEKMVPENAEVSIFNLVDELGQKNITGAIHRLLKMYRQSEPPLRILAMIARHFRLLYGAYMLQQEGQPESKFSASLQVPPFVAKKLLQQLQNFSGESFPRIITLLKETDLQIKTGRLAGEEALEQLIYKLALI